MTLSKITLIALLAAAACPADALYSNTTTDQQDSVFYSASGFTQIGDLVTLTNGGAVDSLSAQFFNAGADATFDAVLQIYASGSPVGDPIGGTFLVTDIFIAGGTSQTVSFSNLGGLVVPQDLAVAFSVQNVSADGDIGVNFFDPPTVGSSDPSFFLGNDGTGFAEVSTFLNHDNLYLEIDGTTAAPEPSTAVLAIGALAALWYRKRSHSGS
jgi:hypothetical protein